MVFSGSSSTKPRTRCGTITTVRRRKKFKIRLHIVRFDHCSNRISSLRSCGLIEASWVCSDEGFTTGHGPSAVDWLTRLGTPETIEQYSRFAQIAQLFQYQALYEGFQAAAWKWYTAVIFWKSQSPWPALRGPADCDPPPHWSAPAHSAMARNSHGIGLTQEHSTTATSTRREGSGEFGPPRRSRFTSS